MGGCITNIYSCEELDGSVGRGAGGGGEKDGRFCLPRGQVTHAGTTDTLTGVRGHPV